MSDHIRALIDDLGELDTNLHEQDLLLTWEQSEADLRAVLKAAEIFEELYRANLDARVYRGGLAVSIFRDKSTRTRFSFASAASLLGLSLRPGRPGWRARAPRRSRWPGAPPGGRTRTAPR